MTKIEYLNFTPKVLNLTDAKYENFLVFAD